MYICLVLILCILHTSSQRDVVANVQSRYKTIVQTQQHKT